MSEEDKCPQCGAGLEELDLFLAPDGVWKWNCFLCGKEWCDMERRTPTEADEEEDENCD